jgi:hypothetical protein
MTRVEWTLMSGDEVETVVGMPFVAASRTPSVCGRVRAIAVSMCSCLWVKRALNLLLLSASRL